MSEPASADEDRMHADRLERRKRKRENRLGHIASELTKLLYDTFPEEADDFEIVYREIQERRDTIFEGTTDILPSQSPAYGIFLKSKSGPGGECMIMHLFRVDVDRRVKASDIRSHYQIPAFRDNIGKCIKEVGNYTFSEE
jgi:hypothetical protein